MNKKGKEPLHLGEIVTSESGTLGVVTQILKLTQSDRGLIVTIRLLDKDLHNMWTVDEEPWSRLESDAMIWARQFGNLSFYEYKQGKRSQPVTNVDRYLEQ